MFEKRNVAFLFDVDGVIIETPHEKAWKSSALELDLIKGDFDFTSFYQRYISGIPGLKGAEIILEKMGHYKNKKIEDQKEKENEAVKFRESKQKFLDEYIESGEFKIFMDIESIIKDAKKDKIPIAAVSSSENAERILRKTEIYNLFDSLTLGAIKHKPPYGSIKKEDIYIFAFGKLCGMLNIEIPKYPIIFEDADKGVRAAKNIGYFCVGIAREGLSTPNSLIRNGADLAYDSRTLFQKGYKGIMGELNKKLFF